MPPCPLNVLELGRLPYREAWKLQQRLFERREAGDVEDTLILVEHPPTVTIGRSGGSDHLKLEPRQFRRRGIDLLEIDRGGDVTFHGPGQVVGYPILDLSQLLPDLHRYVRALEEVMIRVAAEYGIRAGRIPGLSGAWVGSEKLGAVGVKVKRWVTMHGFALNVNTQLEGFDTIVPCGLAGRGVTSVSRLLGQEVDLGQARDFTVNAFASVFEMTPRRLRRPPSSADAGETRPPEAARASGQEERRIH